MYRERGKLSSVGRWSDARWTPPSVIVAPSTMRPGSTTSAAATIRSPRRSAALHAGLPVRGQPPPGALRARSARAGGARPSTSPGGVSGADGEYLRYDIKQGNDTLIALHDRLYSAARAYLDITRSYQPHMTISRIADAAAWRRVLDGLPPSHRTTVWCAA
jgi:hypothetical protein